MLNTSFFSFFLYAIVCVLILLVGLLYLTRRKLMPYHKKIEEQIAGTLLLRNAFIVLMVGSWIATIAIGTLALFTIRQPALMPFLLLIGCFFWWTIVSSLKPVCPLTERMQRSGGAMVVLGATFLVSGKWTFENERPLAALACILTGFCFAVAQQTRQLERKSGVVTPWREICVIGGLALSSAAISLL